MAFPYLGDFLSWLFGFHVPLPLPMFGVLVALAIYAAIWMIHLDAKRRGLQAELVYDFGMFASLCGVVGARLFHILEYPEQFVQDPIGMIFTRGGFSIYGGWVLGTLGGIWYLRRKKMPVWQMADACALGMMLGYAIGRIGCQLAGDGDWGIVADMALKPAWLPDWVWAQTYTGNVIGEVIPPPGVYPTPMYESAGAFLSLGILWALRKHPFRYGWLFAVFMVLTGIARFFVEKIRVNAKYHFLGIGFTQAELVSVVFVLAGVAGMIWLGKRRGPEDEPAEANKPKRPRAERR